LNLKVWYHWVSTLPWRYKWFVILILIRPFIDQYYELKRITPIFSPLYWAGILTILFSIIVSISIKTDRSTTRPYKIFLFWSILYILALVLNFTFKNIWSMGTIAIFMKYITFVFLFFFLTRFVRTDREVLGIITTFLYSCLIIIILIIRSGNFKIIGLYDTVQNIAFYISLGYIANTFLYLKKSSQGQRELWRYFLGLTIVLASFISLQHIATIAIVLVITMIFLYYSRKISLFVMLSSMVFILVFWSLFGNQIVEDYVAPQLNTELEALKGEKETARMFHGRMSRWEVFIPMFFNLNPIAIGFGSAYGLESDFDLLLESNIHNDYFRIMLASGIVGLLVYLYFLFLIFRRARFMKTAERFLVTSSIAVVLLYSVTAYPTIYTSVMYVTLSVFAFALKPIYFTPSEK
jgi:O-antigen ligase